MSERIVVKLEHEGFLFWKLSGREALSEDFCLNLTLLNPDARFKRHELLGKSVTVEIPTQNSLNPRYFNGKVTRVVVGAVELSGVRYAEYLLTVESDLWPLKRDRNLRIFQELTTPQIIKNVLAEYHVNVEDKLTGAYRSWEYCVQYQESSLDFISRLMEHAGITYHFQHDVSKHTMVLTDAATQYSAFNGYETIPYHQTPSGGTTDEEGISQWSLTDTITPGIYSLDDYDFRKPNAWMLEARQNPVSPIPGRLDVYDWPGRFVEYSQAENFSRIRQERWQVEFQQIQGTATAIGVVPGNTFTLTNAAFADDNGEYLTLAAVYNFEENRYASGDNAKTVHRVDFTVIPASITHRPAQVTAWPRTYGPQTAKIVGPEGESIWTDQYGRVKVKFHWDRYATGDDTSSCWIRVSSPWASQTFGGVQIPRVGDEVIVDFINGDPDRPIITGRVYNDAKMPPWALPGAATQMGILTRTKDGTPDNANALRFEDKAGAEQIWIHAERNMDIEVEKDETHWVGKDRKKTIDGNETTTVHKNRTETVDGNEKIDINKNRTETVKGNETIFILQNQTGTVMMNDTMMVGMNQSLSVMGNQSVSVQQSKNENIGNSYSLSVQQSQNTSIGSSYSLDVKSNWSSSIGGSESHDVKKQYSVSAQDNMGLTSGKKIAIEAEDSITLTCGESMISLNKDGTITLSGNDIKVSGGQSVGIKGQKVDIN